MTLGPRIVIAATRSGSGKTAIATGLMAALRRRGIEVAAAKIGPDLVDPRHHELATGRPGRNLDAWLSGPGLIAPLAARAADGADVLVVEGVMGLFDGAADGTPSSTADVAGLLDAPVLLLVDCTAQSASVAALVHGFVTFDPRMRIAGVILNRLASPSHETMIRTALARGPSPVPVLGALHRDERITDLSTRVDEAVANGSLPAPGSSGPGDDPTRGAPDELMVALTRLAEVVGDACDLDGILAVARHAPDTRVDRVPLPRRVGSARVAIAGSGGVPFGYRANVEALEAAGAELIVFDPAFDVALPNDIDALVLSGGFTYRVARTASAALRSDVAARIDAGLVVWAEAGGLLWLTRSLDGEEMVGAIDADATVSGRLELGYRSATLRTDSPLGPAGTRLRGHVMHRSAVDPAGDALQSTGRSGTAPEGFATPRLLASHLHLHLADRPDLAEAFIESALAHRRSRG